MRDCQVVSNPNDHSGGVSSDPSVKSFFAGGRKAATYDGIDSGFPPVFVADVFTMRDRVVCECDRRPHRWTVCCGRFLYLHPEMLFLPFLRT